jgi:hypothetical protein
MGPVNVVLLCFSFDHICSSYIIPHGTYLKLPLLRSDLNIPSSLPFRVFEIAQKSPSLFYDLLYKMHDLKLPLLQSLNIPSSTFFSFRNCSEITNTV